MRSWYAGFFAFGKSSTCTIRPTRMSTLAKSSYVMPDMPESRVRPTRAPHLPPQGHHGSREKGAKGVFPPGGPIILILFCREPVCALHPQRLDLPLLDASLTRPGDGVVHTTQRSLHEALRSSRRRTSHHRGVPGPNRRAHGRPTVLQHDAVCCVSCEPNLHRDRIGRAHV